MPAAVQPSFSRNHILSALTVDDASLLRPFLEAVDLPVRTIVQRPGMAIDFIYFPEDGVVSSIVDSGQDRRVEIGLIGREGMTGHTFVMGVDRSPYEAIVQIGDGALRIGVGDLQRAMDGSPTMQPVFLRFAHTMAVQMAQAALGYGDARLEERLARWLLMCHDRLDGDEMALTHAFISDMLGVRRAGVTDAIHLVEGRGLVRATRGSIRVLDREGLEQLASGYYGPAEAEYERVFGVTLRKTR